ncbi:MAG: hypothetical protein BRD23_02105 [Halobacteriales archaeon SW_9_67_25]|nr:MAG: hypothetical protein BRD23_02105 [Halobacteriales archaeon SW_9_67_25]
MVDFQSRDRRRSHDEDDDGGATERAESTDDTDEGAATGEQTGKRERETSATDRTETERTGVEPDDVIVDGVPVFCLPGDPAMARRGVEEIVLLEAATLAASARDPDEEQ